MDIFKNWKRRKDGQALLRNATDGQAVIALVFLVGGMLVLVGATLAFLIFNFLQATFGFQSANRALAVAMAGANDAILRLVENRDFIIMSPGCKYDFVLGSDSAQIEVIREQGESPCVGSTGVPPTDSNLVYINAHSTVAGRRRRVEMIISLDRLTGEVKVASLKQRAGLGGTSCLALDSNCGLE